MSDAGAIVWLTGLPSAGKSTLAVRVHHLLLAAARPALLLDGDEVRAALSPPPGHDPAARDAFYATLGQLALLAARQGLIVLVAATAHRRVFRARVRTRAASEGARFIEVHVATPAEVAASRDPKGLWAAARAGQAPDFPDASQYEPPLAAEITATGGEDPAAEAAILTRLGVNALPGA